MQHEIRATSAAFASALLAGDAARAAAFYGDDARLLAPATDLISGPAEIEAYWRTGIALGVGAVELVTLELAETRPLAVEIGRYSLTAGSAVERGKYLVLHRRQPDGCWRRSVEVFNPDDIRRPATFLQSGAVRVKADRARDLPAARGAPKFQDLRGAQ